MLFVFVVAVVAAVVVKGVVIDKSGGAFLAEVGFDSCFVVDEEFFAPPEAAWSMARCRSSCFSLAYLSMMEGSTRRVHPGAARGNNLRWSVVVAIVVVTGSGF